MTTSSGDAMPFFTLDEAAQELATRECAARGHDYSVREYMGSDGPVSVHCRRCHRAWKVER